MVFEFAVNFGLAFALAGCIGSKVNIKLRQIKDTIFFFMINTPIVFISYCSGIVISFDIPLTFFSISSL